jgi:hypothetical protein
MHSLVSLIKLLSLSVHVLLSPSLRGLLSRFLGAVGTRAARH